ncbi:MAG: decaprenyl-phosphate phosphoribosyltransferase [Chthonomonadales bacterium]
MSEQTAPDPEIANRGPADILKALILGMRPKQWTKNLFVFAALVFTNNIPTNFGQPEKWHNLGLAVDAFILFCLISGGIYLLNDVADRDKDRLHPVKRKRAIASGRLPWKLAAVAGVIFLIVGCAAGYTVNMKFGHTCAGYIALQIAYNITLKHQVILDVFAIAAGFCFRAVGGAYAIGVQNSVWLLLCTLQLALFLGFGKRRNELTVLGEDAGSHRKILGQYSLGLLDQFIAIVLAGLIVSYALYTITSPTAIQHKFLVVTLLNVMYGVFRYLYLIHIEHKGGSPETILLEDRPMQVNLILWFAEVLIALKVTG